jgi:hypothetical protein
MSVPSSGGKAKTLASDSEVVGCIAVDATSVYWATVSGGLMKVPLGGGTPETLASVGAYNIVLDATSVYWIGETGVMKMPLDGGAVTTLASGSYGYVTEALAVDATNVYWSPGPGMGPGGSSPLLSVPLNGGTPTTLFASDSQAVESIAVDGTSVYRTEWAATDAGVNAVMKLSPK